MNWKSFIAASASIALLALPQNSFTCGASEDPYDYYTSFFSNRLGAGSEYRPFYYTGLLSFYDEGVEDSTSYENDKVIEEWMAYGKGAKRQDVVDLVYKSAAADLVVLSKSVTAAAPLPQSFANNMLAKTLVQEKKGEAVRYLQFAKRTEALSPKSQWDDAPKRDSLQLNRWIAEAGTEYEKAGDAFLKTKYAFQRCKVAFYNHRYSDCIRFCDEAFNGTREAAVTPMAVSYKAGSLFRTGKKAEAAYLFSKLFAQNPQHKKPAYLGFWWASNNADASLIPSYTSLCKNSLEKANMVGMFALYGSSSKLREIQEVYALHPASPLLPLLATREVAKLEEQYFTPGLAREQGGKALYVSWAELRTGQDGAAQKPDGQSQASRTAGFFEKLVNDATLAHRDLYATAAAYLHFMNRDYAGAKALLSKVKELNATASVKDQAALIQLLLAANEAKVIDKAQEAELLPSMKWLVQKAKTDEEYRMFCRNFFSEILAQRYEQQGDRPRAALAYAMADLAFLGRDENETYSYTPAIDFVRDNMPADALLKLYDVMTSPSTETEKFFVQNASVKRDAVIDVIGTAYLRERSYQKAIEWFGKAGKQPPLVETVYNYQTNKERTVNVDPLYDYLNDWQRYTKSAPAPYTKLSLAKKLLDLQTKLAGIDTVADKAKLYYTYASALYNLSYYGNAWSAVDYYRSSSEWNTGKYKLPWEKEYYGVYEARTYYQKAYDAATNKEYKAACFFMVIKCAQRQIPMPEYDYKKAAAADKAQAAFERQFKYNPLFAKFSAEFGDTKFYPYVYNRCSYLRDYVKKFGGVKPAPARPK